jgi:DNA-binding MarR family transcriptional regulator
MADDQLNLGLLCFIAFRSAETRVMEALASAGYDDLTVPQARVLARLSPSGIRMSDLAEQAQVTKQTASSLVDHLERAGYVRRVADPHDQRARLVQFAARGRRACRVAWRVQEEVDRSWSEHLGPRRTQALRDALTRLREITDPWA